MFRIRTAVTPFAVALLATLALAACTGDKPAAEQPASDLPAADALLTESAAAMREIATTRFLITADGEIAGLSLRRAQGVLTKEGSAEGTAQVEQAGQNVELAFVLVGDKIYLRGATGGYQEVPLALAAGVYDPSAILDPDRGVARLLGTVTGARTEVTETVDGTEAYRVAGTAAGADLKAIIPGVTADVPGRFWLGSSDKRLHKAVFTMPAAGGASGTVTVTFTEFDVPAKINAP